MMETAGFVVALGKTCMHISTKKKTFFPFNVFSRIEQIVQYIGYPVIPYYYRALNFVSFRATALSLFIE